MYESKNLLTIYKLDVKIKSNRMEVTRIYFMSLMFNKVTYKSNKTLINKIRFFNNHFVSGFY